MPPSTTSSQTMSACSRPVWGRASPEFSIFTASAERATTSPAVPPVSGQRGSTVGEGGAPFAGSIAAAWVTGARGVGSAVGDPPHAASRRPAPVARANRASGRRRAGATVRNDDTMLLEGVNRATLYGLTRLVMGGRALARTYAGGVSRPVRDVLARPEVLLPALRDALDGTGPAVSP